MVDDNCTSNNHAHLLLYGGGGTGKTLIVSAVASAIPTYKFLVGSRFQNPDLLQSSLLSIEEFDVSQLPSNAYKCLLDLKTHVKIDFKNLNPENVTQGVPSMITTNDEVLNVIHGQKKYNNASVVAALRRLYIIPVKGGPYEKLHGRIDKGHKYEALLDPFNGLFDREDNKLERIFNLILAFALFQQDVQGLYLDRRLHYYFKKVADDFVNTFFGSFYVTTKDKIDVILEDIEFSMMEQD